MGGSPEPGARELLLLRGATSGAPTPSSDPVCRIIAKVSAEMQGCSLLGVILMYTTTGTHYMTPRVSSSQKSVPYVTSSSSRVIALYRIISHLMSHHLHLYREWLPCIASSHIICHIIFIFIENDCPVLHHLTSYVTSSTSTHCPISHHLRSSKRQGHRTHHVHK